MMMMRTRSAQTGDALIGAVFGSNGTAPQSPAASQPPKSQQA
jgi:hypothetical protein